MWEIEFQYLHFRVLRYTPHTLQKATIPTPRVFHHMYAHHTLALAECKRNARSQCLEQPEE